MRTLLLVAIVGLLIAGLPTPTHAAPGDTVSMRLACDSSVAESPTMIRKMESHYLTTFVRDHATLPDGDYGGCFGHVGIQNYFIGRDKVYRLDSGVFRVTATEVGRAPSLERAPNMAATPVGYPVFIESSMDGLTWSYVGHRVVSPAAIDQAIIDNFAVNFPGGTGPEFRFLRARAPISVFDGLSGYIDFFLTLQLVPVVQTFTLQLTEVRDADDGVAVAQLGAVRSCETDILEDPIAAHPCWYGGLNHHDSVSSFHTYFLGNATLDTLDVNVKLGYFRYTDAPGGTLENPPLEDGKIVVESSVDGSNWDVLGEASVPYSLPGSTEGLLALHLELGDDVGAIQPGTTVTFTGLNDLPARFIRIASGKTPSFDDYYGLDCDGDGNPDGTDAVDGCGGNPGARRTAGYLLDSGLVIDGSLPV